MVELFLNAYRCRYTQWNDSSTDEIVARELYNHEEDPLETENIAKEKRYAQKVNELHNLLFQHIIKN